MKFVEQEAPLQLIEYLARAGSSFVRAIQSTDGSEVVVVIVTDDPSGEGGVIERHASVSVSTNGKRRYPTDDETAAAMEAVGMAGAELMRDREHLVHAYQPK